MEEEKRIEEKEKKKKEKKEKKEKEKKEKEKDKEKDKNEHKKIIMEENEDDKNKDEDKKHAKHSKSKHIKRKSSQLMKDDSKAKNLDDKLHSPTKKRNSKNYKARKSQSSEIKIETTNEVIVDTKQDLIDNEKKEPKEKKEKEDQSQKEHEQDNKNNVKDEIQILELTQGLSDQEMNNLEYEVALIIDKRTFLQYYFSLLKKSHILLFTFWPSDDYNLMYMKIVLFIVSFSLYFTINAFFFTDNSMYNIYYNDGQFNLFNHLPQVFYSFFVSGAINMILKMLSLSDTKILAIKKERDPDQAKELAGRVKSELNITLIIFLAVGSVLMLFFWYFISCFCAVFVNTQAILIEDTFLSFALSMISPFIIVLIPCALRFPALRAKKKDKKWLYKLSVYFNYAY